MTTEDAKQLAFKLRRNNPGSVSHEIAASMIEQQAAEIERLKAELGDLPEAQAMLLRDCKVKDALLRQALEALEKTRAFHQQDWSSEEITPKLTRDTIAAIKTHLGEV